MITVNEELAVLLVTAGIEVPSESHWVYRGRDDEERPVWEQFTGKEVTEDFIDFVRYPAPNADELARVLPSGVIDKGEYLHLYYLQDNYSSPRRTAWRAYLAPINKLRHMESFYQEADTLSDAMAKMLIYLKRNHLSDTLVVVDELTRRELSTKKAVDGDKPPKGYILNPVEDGVAKYIKKTVVKRKLKTGDKIGKYVACVGGKDA
jgi:hypothetical protein